MIFLKLDFFYLGDQISYLRFGLSLPHSFLRTFLEIDIL